MQESSSCICDVEGSVMLFIKTALLHSGEGIGGFVHEKFSNSHAQKVFALLLEVAVFCKDLILAFTMGFIKMYHSGRNHMRFCTQKMFTL